MDTELEQILVHNNARFTPLELHLPKDLSMDDWTSIGKRLIRLDQVTKWWLGDWAAFGLANYDGNEKFLDPGEKPKEARRGRFKEFAESHGINYQTLLNLGWVSRSIEISRRRENLEWSKHAEVAALKPDEQDKWLKKAETDNLPVSELRQQIRLSQGEQNALQSDGPATKYATRWLDDLVAWLTARPEGFWNKDRRELWRVRLKPLVDLYQGL